MQHTCVCVFLLAVWLSPTSNRNRTHQHSHTEEILVGLLHISMRRPCNVLINVFSQSRSDLSVTSSHLNSLQLLISVRAVGVASVGATLRVVRGSGHPDWKTVLSILLFFVYILLFILIILIPLLSIIQIQMSASPLRRARGSSALIRFLCAGFPLAAQPLCVGLGRGAGLLLRLPAAFPLHPAVLEPDLDLDKIRFLFFFSFEGPKDANLRSIYKPEEPVFGLV